MTQEPSVLLAHLGAYVAANAERPLTGLDLAVEADMSIAELRSLLGERVGRSPSAFIRRHRLLGARQDLQLGHLARTSVPTVARRWGFQHLARFSSAYAAAFGQAPGDTLRGDVTAAAR